MEGVKISYFTSFLIILQRKSNQIAKSLKDQIFNKTMATAIITLMLFRTTIYFGVYLAVFKQLHLCRIFQLM